MADYRLSKIQRNQVFEAAQRLGLDPVELGWSELTDTYKDTVQRIDHPGTGAFLEMRRWYGYDGRNGYRLEAWLKSIGIGTQIGPEWTGLLSQITTWLRAVKAESDAPDLFELARQERAWLGGEAGGFQANAPFTLLEREQIARHLRTIEEYTIKMISPSGQRAHFRAFESSRPDQSLSSFAICES